MSYELKLGSNAVFYRVYHGNALINIGTIVQQRDWILDKVLLLPDMSRQDMGHIIEAVHDYRRCVAIMRERNNRVRVLNTVKEIECPFCSVKSETHGRGKHILKCSHAYVNGSSLLFKEEGKSKSKPKPKTKLKVKAKVEGGE